MWEKFAYFDYGLFPFGERGKLVSRPFGGRERLCHFSFNVHDSVRDDFIFRDFLFNFHDSVRTDLRSIFLVRENSCPTFTIPYGNDFIFRTRRLLLNFHDPVATDLFNFRDQVSRDVFPLLGP